MPGNLDQSDQLTQHLGSVHLPLGKGRDYEVMVELLPDHELQVRADDEVYPLVIPTRELDPLDDPFSGRL